MSRILQIIPYEVFPPRGGGAMRCFHLLQELTRAHEVHAIIFQPASELQGERNGYHFPSNVKVYSPVQTPPPRSVFDWLPARLNSALHYRWLRRSWRGPAGSTLLSIHHLLAEILRTERIDLVLFESLSAMAAAPLVRRISPHTVQVLDAHNIDHKLMSPDADRNRYENVRWRESHLAGTVDAFFACSHEDKTELERLNGNRIPGFAIPNGVNVTGMPYDANPHKAQQKKLLFCGSLSYPPNQRGLEWFYQNVWPIILGQNPHLKLVVVGRGATLGAFSALRTDPTVEFVGEVENVAPYYHQTSLAIVPLLEGSGTRLKILEAMSLGSPVVSTRIGAEGNEAEQDREILLADTPQEFAAAILRVLADRELFENIRLAGRQLVEQKYDWQVIGREINRTVEQLASRRESGALRIRSSSS